MIDYGDYLVHIGNNIRFIREKNGYSQKELAEKVRCRPASISDYENGKENITIAYMIRISNALRVNPAELLSRSTGGKS